MILIINVKTNGDMERIRKNYNNILLFNHYIKMFKKLQDLVSELNEVNSEKLEKGVYGQCKKARKILQEIKLISQDYRNLIMAYVKKEEATIKELSEKVKPVVISDDTIEQDPNIPVIGE